MPAGTAINQMFSGIAGRYDFANHLLSGGVDFYWRKRLVTLVEQVGPQTHLDLATGSGDVAFSLKDRLGDKTQITGMDFCRPMLEEAKRKRGRDESYQELQFVFGDCMELPSEDNSVDSITIAFGVRNFEDRQKGLQEMKRILKPGGSLFILEFSQPYTWFRPFYYIYLNAILPLVAGFATGKKDAYEYLAGSIADFPSRETLCKQVEEAGYSSVKAIPLTFSIVAIHHAIK